MSVTPPRLHPGDPGYLLGVITAARDDVAGDRGQAQRRKRDIIRAFAGAEVLVATDLAGAPRTVRGTDGDLLLTFTDDEAHAAYWQARGMTLEDGGTAMLGGGPAPGRVITLAALKQDGQREVLLNPAGPAGTVISAAELDAFAPRRFPPMPSVPAPRWLDLDLRTAARAATAERLGALRRALGDAGAGAGMAVDALELNPLGSLETAAASEQLKGMGSLLDGEPERGVNQLTYAAIAYVRFGFPERCVDLVLDGAEPLMAAIGNGTQQPAAGRMSAVVSLLEQMQTEWRSAERDAFSGAFRQLVPPR